MPDLFSQKRRASLIYQVLLRVWSTRKCACFLKNVSLSAQLALVIFQRLSEEKLWLKFWKKVFPNTVTVVSKII